MLSLVANPKETLRFVWKSLHSLNYVPVYSVNTRLHFNCVFVCFFQEFACNGTVVEHPEYGEVLQLQGDQRHKICDWLTKIGLVKADQLKVHGF